MAVPTAAASQIGTSDRRVHPPQSLPSLGRLLRRALRERRSPAG